MRCLIDPIQAEKVGEVRFLLGIHPAMFNTETGKRLLSTIHSSKKLPIEFGIHRIMVTMNPGKNDLEHHAVHLYIDWKNSNALMEILLDVYSSKQAEGYRLVQKGRFIPNVKQEGFIISTEYTNLH